MLSIILHVVHDVKYHFQDIFGSITLKIALDIKHHYKGSFVGQGHDGSETG